MRKLLASIIPSITLLALVAAAAPAAAHTPRQYGTASGRVANAPSLALRTTVGIPNNFVARTLRQGVMSYVAERYDGYATRWSVFNFHSNGSAMKSGQLQFYNSAYHRNYYDGWFIGCGRVWTDGYYIYWHAQWVY